MGRVETEWLATEANLAALTADALHLVTRSGRRWIEPELHRLKGELLLALPETDTAVEALPPTRHRGRPRARREDAGAAPVTSLARLWCDQGRRADARDVLAPVCDWFTEGFDTTDLKGAKALLDELG